MQNNKYHLLVTCNDKAGIVAKISNFLFQHNANIIELDQYSTDPSGGIFFLRLVFEVSASQAEIEQLKTQFLTEIAVQYEMKWYLTPAQQKKRLAILVSKHQHALLEVLWSLQNGELQAEIPYVISNHPDLENTVRQFGLEYHHITVDKDNKAKSEAAILNLVKDKVDGIVLARYMQILSADFLAHFPNKIINIHHSFLPAFIGADPYQQAYDRGVKIIGATAHFVTPDLDAGPIIEQDVVHVSHKQHKDELRRIGRDIERRVFLRAIRWFTEDRIIVYGNKTVVF